MAPQQETSKFSKCAGCDKTSYNFVLDYLQALPCYNRDVLVGGSFVQGYNPALMFLKR